jgi:hypothetical protein
VSALNVRTMPVVRALWVSRRLWFVGLPDGSSHYVAGQPAVERLVAAQAPGSALRFIGAPELPSLASDPRVDRSAGPDACWPWQGGRKVKGYGRLMRDYKDLQSHRVAWEETFGPIPDGLQVLHHCDNPPCCNPAHLFLGTPGDNVRDMVAKGRQPAQMRIRTHCRFGGHALTDDNLYIAPGGIRRCRACITRGRLRRLADRYEASDTLRGHAAVPGASTRTTVTGTRASSNGHERTAQAGARPSSAPSSRPPLGGAPALPLVRLGTRARRPSQPSAERRST